MAPVHVPVKKALCVGICYKGQEGPSGSAAKDFELDGAHDDVDKVIELLTGWYGYDRQNVTVLLDADGHTQPTRENMLSAMEELVRGAGPGDKLFFFFAGHGDQITNLDGKERDMKDEIILPSDWKFDDTRHDPFDRDRYPVKIIDDEMNEILVGKLPEDCHLTALFDSCHSGTLLDLPYERSFGPRSPVLTPGKETSNPSSPLERLMNWPRTTSPEAHTRAPLHRPRPPRETKLMYESPDEPVQIEIIEPPTPGQAARINSDIGRGPLELSYTIAPAVAPRGRMDPYWRKGTWILRGETFDPEVKPSTAKGHVVSWSACSDAQSGFEMQYVHENRSAGVMTEAFVGILKENPHRTYRDILVCLGQRLKKACININNGIPNRDEWIMQEPQLGSQRKPDLDQYFEP